MRAFKTSFFLFLTAFLSLLYAPEVWAVRPFSAQIALVAGDEGSFGYRDGSFTTARFNTPLGLAINGDGSLLFVADSGNNRIRVIHLDQNNEVTTLAGQSSAGKLDGPLTVAQFNDPRGVLYLPGDRLLVNDFGNQLLRLVDLKAGTVTTIAGGSPALGATGTPTPLVPAAQVSMKDVRSMAYVPASDSIFFTQPDSGSLKRLELKTGLVSTVLDKDPSLPRPAALWWGENRLFVADSGSPQVFQLTWKDKAKLIPVPLAAPLTQILSLSSNSGILYALLNQNGVPAQRFPLDGLYEKLPSKPHNGLLSFTNPWGDTIPAEQLFSGVPKPFFSWIGFVPDPSDGRKFYQSLPGCNMIISFRDLFSTGFYNTNNLIAPEYPTKKPKNTYRIIIAGDSRSFEIHNYPFKMDFHPQTRTWYPYVFRFGPQIEQELNFRAALEGIPLNYEVFNVGHHGELLSWPTFELPEIVKKNDIDLVMIFSPQSDHPPYYYYFDHPLTSDGIPQSPNDPEYMLKPAQERIPDGSPRKFYDFCKAHKLVQMNGRNFDFDPSVVTYPELHDMILDFYGKPLSVLNRKLLNIKTSGGQSPKLLVIYTYTEWGWVQHHDTDIWIEASKKFNLPYLDLNPEMSALHLSYYPLTEEGTHFDPDGFTFFGRLIAHDLIRDKLIPWEKVSEK